MTYPTPDLKSLSSSRDSEVSEFVTGGSRSVGGNQREAEAPTPARGAGSEARRSFLARRSTHPG